ncbi:hypothetical protein GOODEAATRI_006300 [Goodea atripinnis]|uniref:F-actin-capping protein subunit beta n=1 Tax=Goodea atripinnis TaxID=208336 RepID=A0ABV0MPS7_9TELE
MRRLPPQQIEKNLSDLIDLVPSLCEDLLSSVDQPLKIARDKVVGKDYLLCDYNRDGDSYRYFEGGVSSVYLWDLDHGFAGVILIKKAGDGSKKIKGCWDSIHVVEVQEKSSGRTAHYKLTSTVMLWLQTTKTGSGTMNLGGSLTRQVQHRSQRRWRKTRRLESPRLTLRTSAALLKSIESLPDNQKYRQLQRELSQVLTQRQIFID